MKDHPDSEPSLLPRTGPMPEFHSIEEEAEWWDTHDITDYLDESWPVQITVSDAFRARVEARRATYTPDRLTVRLDPADRIALDRKARDRGIGPSTLVRMWIKDHLRADQPNRSAE